MSVLEVDQIESWLSSQESASELLAAFRSCFPGRSLTRCDASDICEESPFRRLANADLYLIDGRSHCWQITADPAIATGVLLAARPVRP
ncbi:MAG: hypothetical protein ACLQJ0_14015 [Steroidobacteraceae bacterium]|jgi:hypothetical protein